VEQGQIQAIRIIGNPDKLTRVWREARYSRESRRGARAGTTMTLLRFSPGQAQRAKAR